MIMTKLNKTILNEFEEFKDEFIEKARPEEEKELEERLLCMAIHRYVDDAIREYQNPFDVNLPPFCVFMDKMAVAVAKYNGD
jgi:hypothetical protein